MLGKPGVYFSGNAIDEKCYAVAVATQEINGGRG
jgi:hypothetical protein